VHETTATAEVSQQLPDGAPRFTERRAAAYFEVSAETLRMWRRAHTGPRYFKLGRLIRYALSDLVEWRDRHSTATTTFPADLVRFADECLQSVPGSWARCAEITQAYAAWCGRPEILRIPEALVDLLVSRGFKQSRSRRDDRGKQSRTWEGLSLRSAQPSAESGE